MERTKTVLVVGASGYVGWCLCKILSKSYQVFGTFYRNPFSFEGESTCVDIRDEDAVQNLVDRARPDIIFHLAWDLNDFACKLARFLEHDPERIPRGIKSDSGEIRPLDLSMDISLAKTLFETKLRSIEEVSDR